MDNTENMFQRLNDKFFIERRVYKDSSSMPVNHYHNAYEIYYMLEGDRYYFIKDKTYRVMKGDLVLINIDELHRNVHSGSQNAERILINFQPEFIEDIAKNVSDIDLLKCFNMNNNVVRLHSRQQKRIENVLFNLINESYNAKPGSCLYQKMAFVELLILIYWSIEENKCENNNYEYLSPVHKKISDIVVYLNNNYTMDISLSLISVKFDISIYHLSRLFKKVTGFSFIEYLNILRIKSAQKLLLETKYPISYIASVTGFDSITHFGRTFKAITKATPIHYRKNML